MPVARRGGFKTQAPRQGTLIIAVILWLIGLLAGLHVIHLPSSLPPTLGFWSLVVAGLLLILGSVLDGL
jgi:hypothetical protein